MNGEVLIRPIEAKDFPVMKELLYEAIYQEPGSRKLPFEVIEKPEIWNYIEAFGTRENDLGFVAESNGRVIGAAWSRILFAPIRGYGNLDAKTPELAIAVLPDYRDSGIGSKLLNTLIRCWLKTEIKQTSLSVDKRNRAVRLYLRCGFEIIKEQQDDLIMRWSGFIPAESITGILTAAANPEKASGMRRFFKTGLGQYGEGDSFLGLTNPVVRAFVRKFRRTTLSEAVKLLASPWHEVRLCGGLILVELYAHADEAGREAIFHAYLDHGARFNNWDLVDLTAPGIVGNHLLNRERGDLYRLAQSPILWEQRIAMVSTLTLIRHHEFIDTLKLAERFLTHRHDLMHKACGWMLREVGKRNRKALTAFLHAHQKEMPRTMLRYAIEHYPESERKVFLAK